MNECQSIHNFIDRFPDLPQVIDVGGDKYFMGSQKPIELSFKSRKNYLDSFGNDRRTEYLLRRYMYYSLQDKRKIKFDDPKDKSDLLLILKRRANALQNSKQFTSSTLKNTIIQRSFLNIERLILELEELEYKNIASPKLLSIPNPFDCKKSKKYVKELTEDRKFRLMLQIAWYLLHPDQIPSKVECSWTTLLKDLDTLRLGDIAAEIRKTEQDRGNIPSKNAFNYFKKINIQTVAKAPRIENALDEAKKMATELQGENSNQKMKERLKSILDILEMKKYLSGDLHLNEKDIKNISVTDITNKMKRNMPTNPMSGGYIAKTFNKPLGIAMNPFFDYFKTVYDPVYSLIESSLTLKSGSNEPPKVTIPLLTTLLYICNNLKPSRTNTGGINTFGIYKITNVDNELILFLNKMLDTTQTYLEIFQDDSEKNVFNQQLFQLPKVRLSSLLNRILNSAAKDADEIPYIQFFTVGGNMKLMTEDEFMKSKSSGRNDATFNAVNEFFTKDNIYIACTKQENIKENIPMNTYEIDFSQIDVEEDNMKIETIPDNYFNKNKGDEMYLENLVMIYPYVVFNDAELALSIFIAFKELMPK